MNVEEWIQDADETTEDVSNGISLRWQRGTTYRQRIVNYWRTTRASFVTIFGMVVSVVAWVKSVAVNGAIINTVVEGVVELEKKEKELDGVVRKKVGFGWGRKEGSHGFGLFSGTSWGRTETGSKWMKPNKCFRNTRNVVRTNEAQIQLCHKPVIVPKRMLSKKRQSVTLSIHAPSSNLGIPECRDERKKW